MALRERIRARKARPKRKIQGARFPASAEISYRASLREVVRDSASVCRKHLYPILDRDTDGIVSGVPADLGRAVEKIRVDLEGMAGRARRLAQASGQRVELLNRKALNETYRKAIGVEPFKAPIADIPRQDSERRLDARAPIQEVMQTYLKANVALISSIPSELLGQVEDELREAFPRGLRVEKLKKIIEERFDVAESRAQLIARDQVAKLNGQLTETRNRSLGVTSYTWQTVQDERVRGTPGGVWPKGFHYALNGQKFRYDDPPVTNDAGDRNHPGGDYQCRCIQLPDLEGALESLGI